MSQRLLGYGLTVVGGLLALLAFFTMPYIAYGFISATGSQIAGGLNGLAPGYGMLWLEPVIAALVVLIVGIQLFGSQSSGTEVGQGVATGVVVVSALTLLIVFCKYLFVDTQGTTTTDSLGITSTSPAMASLYGSGFWVYLVGIVVILVGGILAMRSYPSIGALTTSTTPYRSSTSNTPSGNAPSGER